MTIRTKTPHVGLFTLVSILFVSSASAQTRAFMDAAGNAGAGQPTTGNTVITMDPGTSQEIEVWVVDDSPAGAVMNAYQLIFQCDAVPQAGATGSVAYLDNNPGLGDGDSVVLDTNRPDWIFAGSTAVTDPAYNETCTVANFFGLIYATAVPADDVDINATFGTNPAYMTSFAVTASADACGEHVVQWNLVENGGSPPLTALFAPGITQWLGDGVTATEFQNLTVSFGPSNDDCADAIDLGSGTMISEPYDTTCATVDGPQDCATGADIWYTFSDPLGFAPLVEVTAGEVVVYPAGTCTPGPGGVCSGEDIPGATDFLVQVIGDDIQGTLSITTGCACFDNADCDDGNPCTDNTCVDCECITTNNADPCDDGDPCTEGDVCSGGMCMPGPPTNVDDMNDCTNDFCDPGSGAVNEDINGAPCTNDGDCNPGTVQGGVCGSSGFCICPCDGTPCCDADEDGIRDDGCVWCQCDPECGNSILEIDIVFADMGGPFGDCMPDGVADNNDNFHALNCFANVDVNGNPKSYPCEELPPFALNVDAGGEFGACIPDGVCDANDAFLALNAFAGSTTCSCPFDPRPEFGGTLERATITGPHITESVALRLEPSATRIAPDGTIDVRVSLDGKVDDLRGYQLHLGIDGGTRGALELVDIFIDDDAVYEGLGAWRAFNRDTAQMLAGLNTDGVAASAGSYLATFTLRPSRDARGTFVVDLLHDDDDRTQRTFLFPTAPTGRVAIDGTTPAVITVGKGPAVRRSR